MKPEYLTPKQYAAAHRLHYNTVLNWIKAGKIDYRTVKKAAATWYTIRADEQPPRLHTRHTKKS